MFILTTVEDVIAIEPDDFSKSSVQALHDNINEKYTNKIIPGVGLCICFFDLIEASDGRIGHGRGAAHVKAHFRLIIFRPFKGEILEGTIESATSAGITVSLEFFDDILIPGPGNLFPDCHFNESEQVWIWINDGTKLFFDKNERVRFRVEEEIWTDLAPTDQPKFSQSGDSAPPGPRITNVNDGKGQHQGRLHQELLSETKKKNMRAWRLVGSMTQGGLGLLSWWD